MDVSDIIDYNIALLGSDRTNSFFCLSRVDPTVGFPFDATERKGHAYAGAVEDTIGKSVLPHHNMQDPLYLRLLLASHLAQYLRTALEAAKGYTATVGISTNKLLSKLVGNQNKPDAQTSLLPPYVAVHKDAGLDNVTSFMDDHEIGKIPGIGFKMAQKLRAHVLQRPPEYDAGLVYGATKESVSVRDVRQCTDMGPELLERILGGVGIPHGIGAKVWGLINGSDDTDGRAKLLYPCY